MASRPYTPEEFRQALIDGRRDHCRRSAEQLRASAAKANENARKAVETAASLPAGSRERKVGDYWAAYLSARAEYYTERAKREEQGARA